MLYIAYTAFPIHWQSISVVPFGLPGSAGGCGMKMGKGVEHCYTGKVPLAEVSFPSIHENGGRSSASGTACSLQHA